jgi:membrane fusion protein (multidrug efflux system)
MHALKDTSIEAPISLDTKNPSSRKRMFTLFGLVLAILALAGFLYWFFIASRHVTTDNAYAAADVAQVTPSISGTVKAITVFDTQAVKAGDVLVSIDDTDAQLSLKKARANVDRSSADLARAQSNFNRRKQLAASGYISAEELNNSENMFKDARASLDAANANLEQARVDIERTVIRAPIDGVVAKRDVQLGQRIAAGMHLLSIVPVTQIYINANFKEVQLRDVKIGQPVELHADLYGSSVVYHGKIVGVAGGTGAAFAIIPAQNATGNWIKVVQRLPVRITLDPKELQAHPLQVGLSMHADIHIGKQA